MTAATTPTTTLAVDIGGTKILAALVQNNRVVQQIDLATVPDAGATGWTDAVIRAAMPWRGGFHRIGITVTGIVADGRWSALNPATLDIPDGFALADRIEAGLGLRPTVLNDAQAAAWGEYRLGAAQGRDMVFLTISTGIGGGVVLNGR